MTVLRMHAGLLCVCTYIYTCISVYVSVFVSVFMCVCVCAGTARHIYTRTFAGKSQLKHMYTTQKHVYTRTFTRKNSHMPTRTLTCRQNTYVLIYKHTRAHAHKHTPYIIHTQYIHIMHE